MTTEAPERIKVTYTNWKGVTSERTITPNSIRFDATDWHPEPQWLLRAWDEDRQAWRDFALKDFDFRADLATRQQAEAVAAAYEAAAERLSQNAKVINEAYGKVLLDTYAAGTRLLTPSDATAALEARDARVWDAAIEAAKEVCREEGVQSCADVLDDIKKGSTDAD